VVQENDGKSKLAESIDELLVDLMKVLSGVSPSENGTQSREEDSEEEEDEEESEEERGDEAELKSKMNNKFDWIGARLFLKDLNDKDIYGNGEEEETPLDISQLHASSKGLCGLRNIGNTCYMNSALQCLSNTQPMRRVFLGPPTLQRSFSASKILLALTSDYTTLARAMWSGSHSSVAPQRLHYDVALANPMFRGFAQHDSQEFLRTLLDSLHEALKRNDYSNLPPTLGTKSSQQDKSSSTTPSSSKASSKHANGKANGAASTSALTAPPAPKPVIPTESPISALFEGKLLSTVTCGSCGRKSETLDRFFDLSLSIPSSSSTLAKIEDRKFKKLESKQNGPVANGELADFASESRGSVIQAQQSKSSWGFLGYVGSTIKNMFSSGPSVELTTCLHGFCVEDELTGADRYRCEHCKLLHDATKCFSIAQLPHVLCLHIKRFKYDSFFGTKVSDFVKFPLANLDLTDFYQPPPPPSSEPSISTSTKSKASEGRNGIHSPGRKGKRSHNGETKAASSSAPQGPIPLYNLFGVICHSGSLHGGHYYSYARNSSTGKWFEFNDSQVSEVDEAVVEQSEAYVLFYEQQIPQEKIEERIQVTRDICTFLEAQQSLEESHPNMLPPPDTQYVPLTWLTKWLNVNNPGPVNAPGLMCQHGRCLPKIPLSYLMPIPGSVAKHFLKSYGGVMVKPFSDNCSDCLNNQAEERKKKEEESAKAAYIKERQRVEHKKVSELSTLLDKESSEGYYFVDSAWVSKWLDFVNAKSQVIPGPITNEVLLPPNSHPKKGTYRALNRSVWSYLHETYGGGPPIWGQSSGFPHHPHEHPSEDSAGD
jgi:ubiquitin carboxyl-terminal hydrolase 20/33